MTRRLSLRREALTELSFDELHVVHGGAQTMQGLTCPVSYCATDILSRGCPTYTCCTASASC